MLLTLSVILTLLLAGCGTTNPRHQNVNRLIQAHQKGFEDAVVASPDAEAFVKDALTTIANLEGELIRRE
jgi:hypothetical protein